MFSLDYNKELYLFLFFLVLILFIYFDHYRHNEQKGATLWKKVSREMIDIEARGVIVFTFLYFEKVAVLF